MFASLLSVLVLSLVACGEEDGAAGQSESAAATAASAPAPAQTATQVVIEVTQTPIPTATPNPTPTAVPPTPTAVPPTPTAVPPTPTPAIDINALYDVGPERPFPDALLGSSDRLDRDEAVTIWDTFLGNTRVIGELSGPNILDLCADHTGKWLVGSDFELEPLTGMTFTWEIISSVAGRWNESKLVMTSDQFSSLTYGNHLIHRTSSDSLYTVLLPIGGLTAGEPKPGFEYQTIMTNQAQDHNYEFGATTDTTCTR